MLSQQEDSLLTQVSAPLHLTGSGDVFHLVTHDPSGYAKMNKVFFVRMHALLYNYSLNFLSNFVAI